MGPLGPCWICYPLFIYINSPKTTKNGNDFRKKFKKSVKKEIFYNKQRLRVQLSYNKVGREILRKFGNGTEEHTHYDDAGRVTVKLQKNDRGELLWGEGYVYGEDGKRTATVDNQGRVTFYEYNNKGQLSSVYYPYTQEMTEKLKDEAETNGIPTTAGAGENRFLTSSEKASIVPLLNSMQYGLAYNLTNMQVLIKESYVYDRNGNRTAKISPYGKIEYSYDKENYLLSSGSKGQSFINYTYDVMGNLLTEESTNKTVKYAYNAQNRLIYCEVTDIANKEYAQTTYGYDAFGRRILVQDKNEAALRTLYDGLTFDVIKQSPTFQNGQFTDSQNTGIKFGATGRPTGDRYRYLGDEDTKDGNRYFYLDDGTYKTKNSRYRGERTQFTVNGTLAAQTTSEGTDYFSTDLLGSIRSVSDGYGKSMSSFTYDAFGSLVEGSLSGTTDHGYLGKQHDPTTKLYNYGYRDYNAHTSRFTTLDPIRDGTNWFSYCNGDPVNFIDFWGLEANDKGYTDVLLTYLKNGNDKLFVTTINYDANGAIISISIQSFHATNRVLTPKERGDPVLYKNYYYYPEQFPDGIWNVDKSHASTDPYVGPKSMSTDAERDVDTYDKINDKYIKNNKKKRDDGYSIHSGIGETTKGCIKMSTEDLEALSKIVDNAIDSGGKATLFVGDASK